MHYYSNTSGNDLLGGSLRFGFNQILLRVSASFLPWLSGVTVGSQLYHGLEKAIAVNVLFS